MLRATRSIDKKISKSGFSVFISSSLVVLFCPFGEVEHQLVQCLRSQNSVLWFLDVNRSVHFDLYRISQVQVARVGSEFFQVAITELARRDTQFGVA